MNNLKKGFTLIELLIVIAILAVLSVAVVLVLNPAELLKQARDSTRISDMAAINSASYLYAYGCNALGYKIGTVMESNKYGNPTTGYMRNSYDGGINNGWYEVGNNLAL